MNRKLIIAIIGAAVLLLVGLVIIWFIVSRVPADDTNTASTNTNQVRTNTDTTTTTTTTDSTTTDTTQDTTVVVQQDDQQAITSSSRSFTERFGSYSSDTNFENIERSRYLMTDTMSQQADKLISQGQDNSTFFSIESDVTGVTFTDYTDGATGATVEVAVRQKKTVGQQAAVYSNQIARLTLKKVGGSWKVDSFRWL
ncbi:MAG: hypothetical protein HY565_02730 [Candidatus Kerfeldbacteria bacterium]|nr:hypothetical protein [Candidatus Kerfeldbacteria bacterium]